MLAVTPRGHLVSFDEWITSLEHRLGASYVHLLGEGLGLPQHFLAVCHFQKVVVAFGLCLQVLKLHASGGQGLARI